jgi:CHAD domain-containing protein/CYTH domain-containing protein
MTIDARLIDRSVKPAVRLIALDFLVHTEAARRAWKEGTDPEALHDLRVSLRRLRSCLRAYAPYLQESVRRKDRTRLSALAAVTGDSRDREVQLQRLARIAPDSEAEALAVKWLIRHLEAELRASDAEARRVIDAEFPRERTRLERRLTHFEDEIDPAHPDASGTSLAFVAAGLVTVHGAELDARLAAVRDARDQKLAHDARIAGKRLRYVLEPLRPAIPLAVIIVDRLKALQDLLGDMHDADVLHALIAALLAGPSSTDDAPPEEGLRALMARFAAERAQLFERVKQEWLGQHAVAFFDEIRRAAQALRMHASDSIEIERKYLLDGMPPMARRVRRVRIDQGWLPGERLQERLRRVSGPDGIRWFRTVKSGRGIRRVEIEEETTRDIFNKLWRHTHGRRVHKRRYFREDGGLVWEIDQFLDRDLVLAEVELPAVDTPVHLPKWLEGHLVREVTGDTEFVNVNLAK